MEGARATLDRLIAAFNARDYETYATLCTDDVEAYAGVYTPLRFDGKAAWLAFVRGLEERFAMVTQEQRHVTVRTYGPDTAVSNGYFVFSTVTKDGVSEAQSGRQSFTLVKVADQWLVANLHFSALF